MIDEKGEVIEAKALRGHPLLIPTSLRAAKASAFEPIVIGGQNTKVTGIIVYNYLSNSMNWLELGYSSDSFGTLQKYLPAGFETEREFIGYAKNAAEDQRGQNMDTVLSLIRGRLSDDEKSLWLFSLGKQLKVLETFHWDPSQKSEAFREIDNLLNSRPENVSVHLANTLKDLIGENESSALNAKLLSLTERLYTLGN